MSRLENLALVPFAFKDCVVNLGYSLVGAGASLVSTCTGEKFKTINDWSTFTACSKNILNPLHEAFVSVLAPKATMGRTYTNENGLISEKILSVFTVNCLLRCGTSKNEAVRKICTRLCFAVKAVATLVTKAVDLTLGLTATGVSLVLLGQSDTINRFAQKQLHATDVVHSFCTCIKGIADPTAVYKSLRKEYF
ncbi:MAG: hypothetical protein LLF94_09275 [Chlamydiales bacterium]|nr:hypothetical protein [Chlamydiales bacterium]